MVKFLFSVHTITEAIAKQ